MRGGRDDQGYWEKQVVLITGASRGIGAELARRLARHGARIAVNYKSNAKLASQVSEECLKLGAPVAITVRADVTIEAEVDAMIATIQKDLGPVSVLVNNAGGTADNLTVFMSTDEWNSVIRSHLDGAFFCTRAVLPAMIREGFGRVVNIGSINGLRGRIGQSNYASAMAGLVGFTKSVAREVGRKAVTCNLIAAGMIDTDLTRALPPAVAARAREEVERNSAIGRLGTPSDVAGVAEFLASEASSYVTGQVIAVDGGLI